jgi:hypothetical protein
LKEARQILKWEENQPFGGHDPLEAMRKRLGVAMKAIVVVTKERGQLRTDIDNMNKSIVDIKEELMSERAKHLVSYFLSTDWKHAKLTIN